MKRSMVIGAAAMLLVAGILCSAAVGQVNYRAAKDMAKKLGTQVAGRHTDDDHEMEFPPEVVGAPVGKGVLGIIPDPRAVESGLYIMPRPAVTKATVQFTVTEPSGVARKGYPVYPRLPNPEAPPSCQSQDTPEAYSGRSSRWR